MKQSIFTILENKALTKDVYKMVLEGDTCSITAPGQFVNIQLEGKFLRRPISVCDWSDKTQTIIYKVVGKGTEQMKAMAAGEKLDILTGLGNGYDMTAAGSHPVLIGGGVGVPPMYGLAKRLAAQGVRFSVILGFNTQSEIFYEDEFKALGADVVLALDSAKIGVMSAGRAVAFLLNDKITANVSRGDLEAKWDAKIGSPVAAASCGGACPALQ